MIKTVRDACVLQPNALDIHVGDQIEQIDAVICDAAQGEAFFAKTFITGGMETLLRQGLARLAGKSSSAVFHLKQAMGGGKTHLMLGFGFAARHPSLRQKHLAG
jgi:predicted AAA+ superfamily ATPase